MADATVPFLRRAATGRNVLISLAVVITIVLLFQVSLLPDYRAVSSGFDPMDLQFPLTREMVAIQRGAFGPGIHQAYLRFATLDCVFPFANAVFLVLFWAWLLQHAPRPILTGAAARLVFLLPFIAAICDVGENVGFVLLVFSTPRDPQFQLTTITLQIHQAKYLLVTLNNALTLAMIATVALQRLRARKAAP